MSGFAAAGGAISPWAPIPTNLQLYLDVSVRGSYPGSGTIWNDLSGNNKHYTLTNTPTYSGSAGGALTFAGASSQYANATTTLFDSTASAYTISIWVFPTGAGVVVQVNGQATPNTGYHYSAIEINATPTISFGQWTGVDTVIGTSTQSFNKWYNLVISYTGTIATAYVNGASVGSITVGWSSPGAQTFFGLMATTITNMGTSSYASGSLGQFLVYNRALSSAEILFNFNSLRNRFGA